MRYFCFMEVDDAMISKLASLARLRFDEAEQAVIKNDLQKMISFVNKMSEVDTSNVEPLLHMSQDVNTWRPDEKQVGIDRSEALKNSASQNGEFFLVPKVIKK